MLGQRLLSSQEASCSYYPTASNISVGQPCTARLSYTGQRQLGSTHFQQMARSTWVVARAMGGEEEPSALGDWREFRAKLVMQSRAEVLESGSLGYKTSSRQSEDNMRLLEMQDPVLHADGVWAHATSACETGGILVSSNEAADILGNDKWWQLVVLLIAQGRDGTVGLVLNKPTSLMFGRKKGGLPFSVEVDLFHSNPTGVVDLQGTFSSNQVYMGGFTAQSVVHLLHGQRLPGAVEIVPGVFLGGEAAAEAEVLAGRVRPEAFKFFSGALVWEPGQLERQVKGGVWYQASCSRSLLLKDCVRLPVPLWQEVLKLMGGQYLAVAAEGYEGDE